jgi:hypothetical protein
LTNNQTCTNQQCVNRPPTCTAQNCPGCCDGQGACQGGFLNNQCGSGGNACINCTSQRSTCNTAVDPRACTNQQTQCPDPYGGCAPGVSTGVPPTVRNACSAVDLANGQAACSAGPETPACQSYIAFLTSTKPGCLSCLKPFLVPFQDLSGLFACVAPHVSSACRRNTGCAMDCQSKSCDQCQPSQIDQCENNVRTGQCGSFFQQSVCVFSAFQGPGAFCNPQSYQGNYGAWLRGVGGRYCGP